MRHLPIRREFSYGGSQWGAKGEPLLDQVKVLTHRVGGVPVVALAVEGRRGVVLVLDAEDLPTVAAEWAAACAAPTEGSPEAGAMAANDGTMVVAES